MRTLGPWDRWCGEVADQDERCADDGEGLEWKRGIIDDLESRARSASEAGEERSGCG